MELDNPVWAALNGPHHQFAQYNGRAVRYLDDVSRFAAIESPADLVAWGDLAPLAHGNAIALIGVATDQVPKGWRTLRHLPVVQMIDGDRLRSVQSTFADLEALGPLDVPEMLQLVALTEPGPFQPRTIELGGYLGIRAEIEGNPLVAMAGQRLATNMWREVSAVCTDPAYQGRGFARRLVNAVVARAHSRGERTFLHVLLGNPAIGLYDAMGFESRREIDILVVQHLPAD